MEIELHPALSLLPEPFNVLVAPVEMLVEALNSHLNLQRYKVLYVCENLSHLDRNFHGAGSASHQNTYGG